MTCLVFEVWANCIGHSLLSTNCAWPTSAFHATIYSSNHIYVLKTHLWDCKHGLGRQNYKRSFTKLGHPLKYNIHQCVTHLFILGCPCTLFWFGYYIIISALIFFLNVLYLLTIRSVNSSWLGLFSMIYQSQY